MRKSYDVIVIGAGNGGLAAAATCAKAGLSTLLLERHNIPGGSASSFVRGRFEFEPSLHELSGVGTPEKPGMVQAFFNMSQAGNNIDITMLSGGIYTAMITTVAGLIVGILAYFGYNYLTSKVSDLVFTLQSNTIEFMDLLHEPGGNGK